MAINLRKATDPPLEEEVTPGDKSVMRVLQQHEHEFEYEADLPESELDKVIIDSHTTAYKDKNGQVRRIETRSWETGKLKSIQRMDEHGNLHGEQVTCHEKTGKMKTSVFYAHGEKHGEEVHENEFGITTLKMSWASNEPDGLKETFSEKGIIKTRTPFVKGVMYGLVETFHDNGAEQSATNYVDGVKHGLAETYFAGGGTETSVIYNHDLKDSVESINYADGTPKKRTQFALGKKHGFEEAYDKDSGNFTRKEFQQDKQCGEHLVWDRQKKLIERTQYENGYRQGLSVRWLGSGGYEVARYNHDAREGDSETYTETGLLRSITPYVGGEMHGVRRYINPKTGEVQNRDYYWKGMDVSALGYMMKSNWTDISHFRFGKLLKGIWNNTDSITSHLYLQSQTTGTKLLEDKAEEKTPRLLLN